MAPVLLFTWADVTERQGGGSTMKYLVAWLLGVPGILILLWMLLSNT
jgi:hypothetical protein